MLQHLSQTKNRLLQQSFKKLLLIKTEQPKSGTIAATCNLMEPWVF